MEKAPTSTDIDLFALRVVVREGRPMALTRDEKIVAAQLMRRKGVDSHTQAYRLGIDYALVHKFWAITAPVDLDGVPADVVGAPLPKYTLTRDDVRMMTGS